MLPSGYLQLEYLESTGTQYINTNYIVNNNTKIDCDFSITSITAKGSDIRYYSLFGNGDDGISFNYTQAVFFNKWGFIFGNVNPYTYGVYTLSLNEKHKLKMDKYSCDVDDIMYSFSGGTASSNRTLRIFDNAHANTGLNFKFYGKVYSFKIYEENSLVRDFIPTMRLSDNVVGLYDLANDVFYTNAGSGTFKYPTHKVLVNINPTKAQGKVTIDGQGYYDNAHLIANSKYPWNFLNWTLPYTRLEYIESTGTQYIDTGFKPNNNTRVKIEVSDLYKLGEWPFGARKSDVSSAEGMSFAFALTQGGVYRSDYGDNKVSFSLPITKSKIKIDKNKNVCTLEVDGNTYSAINSLNEFSAPVSLKLFALDTNGTLKYASIKYYSCKIYDNDILVRDYIPVIRHSDGAIGLLDLVNLKFYGNSGRGAFIASQEIGGIVITDNPYDFLVGENITLTANFKKIGGKKYLIGS